MIDVWEELEARSGSGGDREKLTRAINKRGRECLLKKLAIYSILGDRDQ